MVAEVEAMVGVVTVVEVAEGVEVMAADIIIVTFLENVACVHK